MCIRVRGTAGILAPYSWYRGGGTVYPALWLAKLAKCGAGTEDLPRIALCSGYHALDVMRGKIYLCTTSTFYKARKMNDCTWVELITLTDDSWSMTGGGRGQHDE